MGLVLLLTPGKYRITSRSQANKANRTYPKGGVQK